MRYLLHIPKTGGTSLLVSGIPGGHHIKYEKGKKYFTILRNPISRLISQFSEMNISNQNRMDSWFIQMNSNFQTKWLMDKLNTNDFRKMIRILKKDFIILHTEHLTSQMKRLGYKVNHLNKTQRKYSPTNKEIQLIKDYNKLDLKLYYLSLSNDKKSF